MPEAAQAPAVDEPMPPAREIPTTGSVELVPSCGCFLRSLAKPDGLPASEWAGFAELALEGMAPFPLDQLAWGWHSRPDSARILLWAAHADRLTASRPGLEGAGFAVPSLVAGLGAFAARPSEALLLQGEDELVLLAPAEGASDPLPSVLIAEPVHGGADDAAALAATRERLRRRASGASFPDKPALAIGRGRTLARGGAEIPLVARPGEDAPASTVLGEDLAWAADVRDPAFRDAERRRRGRARLADRAVVAALGALAALLLLQLGLVGLRSLEGFRRDKLAARDDSVRRLQAKLSLAEKIEQFAQQEMKPLQMLALVNRNRPKAAHLTRASTESFTQMRVEGEASSAEAVNTFVDQLSDAAGVAGARVERVLARDGRASFTLVVQFDPDAFAEPDAAPAVETAAATP